MIKKVSAFLRLIRFQNLAMIALTQLLLRYFVLRRVFEMHALSMELDHGLFLIIILSTVMVAAGGYVINDYFDVKTDSINHPATVVVDRVINRRWAIILHLVFTIGGVLLGMYAALLTGYLRLAIFHIGAAMLLWFYSTHFKRQVLTGNLTVALLTAAVAFMPFVYEMGVLQRTNPGFYLEYRAAVFTSLKYAWIFSIFAFITTLAREIIKDLQDEAGDRATGCNTMPIAWGDHSARITAFFLLVITVILLLFVIYNTARWQHTLVSNATLFIGLLLVLPLSALSIYVLRANRSAQYGRASIALKGVMLAGLMYSLVFYYS